MDFVIAVVVSIAVGVMLVEFYAWLPHLSQKLLERAVRRVCAEDRERWREEWSADLNALPNTLVKLFYAVTNFSGSAVEKINADLLEAKCDEMGELLAGVCNNQARMGEKLADLQAIRKEFGHEIDELLGEREK
jgi:hypothetical protein